jgi:hypothetical protein
MTSKFTRRDFIMGSGAALLASSIAMPALGQTRRSSGLTKLPPAYAADGLTSLAYDNFVPYIGEVMQVQASDGRSIPLRLIAAENLRERPDWHAMYKGDSYSLTFETTRKGEIRQDVFKFEHYALGSFSLLLAPVGLTGRRFEAIINRTQA